jgi:hypothetical protein
LKTAFALLEPEKGYDFTRAAFIHNPGTKPTAPASFALFKKELAIQLL